jgi:hypothetical protein
VYVYHIAPFSWRKVRLMMVVVTVRLSRTSDKGAPSVHVSVETEVTVVVIELELELMLARMELLRARMHDQYYHYQPVAAVPPPIPSS